MYNLSDTCCICFYQHEALLKLNTKSAIDNIPIYAKLITAVPEMCIKELNNNRMICHECTSEVETAYNFRKKCLVGKGKLLEWIVREEKESLQTKKDKESLQTKKDKEILQMKKEKERKLEVKFIKTEEDITIEENDYTNYGTDTEKKDTNSVVFNVLKISEPVLNPIKTEIVDVEEDDQRGNVNDQHSIDSFGPNEQDVIDQGSVQKYPTSSDLKTVKETIISKPFMCYVCLEDCKNPKGLQYHKEMHNQEELFCCKLCDKSYIRTQVLIRHVKTVHIRNKAWPCNFCDKKFSATSHLEVHMRKHTGEKPFQCQLCVKKFTTKSNLEKHVRVYHFDDKEFECSVCGKKFKEKNHLLVHNRIHTGERPYFCEVCQKKFVNKGHLARHRKVHSWEKPYICHICSQKFKVPISLRIHMRKHTGETPFECGLCKEKFICKRHLDKHLLAHQRGENMSDKPIIKQEIIEEDDVLRVDSN